MDNYDLFRNERYNGCIVRHTMKNSEVYMPYKVNNNLFIVYKVIVPIIELGYGVNDIKEILDYAIANCKEIGVPLSASSNLPSAKDIIHKYADMISRDTSRYMPFDFEVLKSGKPLKRKEWKGFWIWDNTKKTIMIHCANGEVLDIRMSKDMEFTLSNIFSIDWEIVTEDNCKLYKKFIEEESKLSYKVIGFEYDAFDKFKCPVCGGDINMEYDMYNGVMYDRECNCKIRIEDRHVINVEIRQYLDDCELDQ